MRSPNTLALSATLTLSATTLAQSCVQAPNESCATSLVFTTGDLPFNHADLLGCQNDLVDRPYFDVFFRYDCTTTAEHRLSACGTTGDSYMRLYADACSFLQSSFWVDDDDSCGELDPMITIELESGHSYWIELGAWRPDEHFPPNANDPYLLSVVIIEPCPADLDADSDVDFEDVLVFLVAFARQDPLADFFPDGSFDSLDVVDFLNAFAAGCP